MQAGRYELVFAAGDYFAAQGVALPEPRFVDRVTIAFGVADPARTTTCRWWSRPGRTRPTAAAEARRKRAPAHAQNLLS
jgi:hypothetical protein